MSLFAAVPPRRGVHLETELQRLARGDSRREVQARMAIELWLEELPTSARNEFTARMLSGDIGFHSAFFELYLHSLFLRLGYEPELHPRVSLDHAKAPDFLMRRRGAHRFYLEATVVEEDRAILAGRRMMRMAHEALAEIESPDFDLGVEALEGAEHEFPRKKVIKSVAAWLETLDVTDVDIEAISRSKTVDSSHGMNGRRGEFKEDGLRLVLWARPRPFLARGIKARVRVRRVGTEYWAVACAGPVRKALLDKAYRYGDLPLPCIVALNVLNEDCDIEEIQGGTFGPLKTHVSLEDRSAITVRGSGGALSDPERTASRRVAAVLAEVALTPWTMAGDRVTPVLLRNPEARPSLPPSELPFLQIENGRGDFEVGGRPYVPAKRILGLDRTIIEP